MKKYKLGPSVLFVFVLVALLASFVFSAQTSAVTEEAKTLQMIAAYRTWGKANMQPVAVSVDNMAPAG